MRYLVLFVVSVLMCPWVGVAATSSASTSTSKQSVEISAQEALDWDRAGQKFIARGAALAKQGEVSVAGTTLTASYDENATEKFDIHTLIAEGGVVLRSDSNVAYGDYLVYDLKKSYAVLTGNTPRIQMPDQVIVANNRFEYFVEAGKLVASDGARVERADDTLNADKITAYLEDDAQGKRSVRRVEAQGNVVIVTPTETVTGARGVYNVATEDVELFGGVTIKRGPNILRGARAHVDLVTQMSHLYSEASSDDNAPKKRVTGTFYPE